MRFTKMHGLGNDYVYVDGFEQSLAGLDLPALSRRISDRHRGVGSDGLILITPPSPGITADARMEMYNADGSRGEMCGNGIRCVGKYVVEKRHKGVAGTPGPDNAVDQTVPLRIETDRGVLNLEAMLREGVVNRVRVDMGRPILAPAEIPVRYEGARDRCVHAPLEVAGARLYVTCVSMGNPHAVTFVENVAAFELERIGPLVERHPMFPNRVNYHVAQGHSPAEATMRTWERGSGITQACGTGACAVLVAAVLEDRLSRRAMLHLPGGDLEIEWPQGDGRSGVEGHVFKTGPAEEVFRGEYSLIGPEVPKG
ncbi:MAG TPA: diaminopimelate epimerase [Phycisphaerae bacterium]|nr:diaminopimelate epimerase [Phycisphaerae bacterium]